MGRAQPTAAAAALVASWSKAWRSPTSLHLSSPPKPVMLLICLNLPGTSCPVTRRRATHTRYPIVTQLLPFLLPPILVCRRFGMKIRVPNDVARDEERLRREVQDQVSAVLALDWHGVLTSAYSAVMIRRFTQRSPGPTVTISRSQTSRRARRSAPWL